MASQRPPDVAPSLAAQSGATDEPRPDKPQFGDKNVLLDEMDGVEDDDEDIDKAAYIATLQLAADQTKKSQTAHIDQEEGQADPHLLNAEQIKALGQGCTKLAKHMGMDRVTFVNFTCGRGCGPAFHYLARHYIDPHRKESKQFARGHGLGAVQGKLSILWTEFEERDCEEAPPDTWEYTEHEAYFVYRVYREEKEKAGGMLRTLPFSKDALVQAIYLTLRFMAREHTPSKTDIRAKRTNKKQAKQSKASGGHATDEDDDMVVDNVQDMGDGTAPELGSSARVEEGGNNGKSKKDSSKHSSAQSPKRRTRTPKFRPVSDFDVNLTDEEDVDRPYAEMLQIEKAAEAAVSKPAESTFEAMRKRAKAFAPSNMDIEKSFMINSRYWWYMLVRYVTVHREWFNAFKHEQDPTFEPLTLVEFYNRFWEGANAKNSKPAAMKAAGFLRAALSKRESIPLPRESAVIAKPDTDTRLTANILLEKGTALDEEDLEKAASVRNTKNEKKGTGNTEEAVDDMAEQADDFVEPEYSMPSATLTDRTKERNELVNNVMYDPVLEPTDYQGACERLHMQIGASSLHLKTMSRDIGFKWWQITGIDRFLHFKYEDQLHGAILADKVGLGKTYTMLGFLLADFEKHLKAQRHLPPEQRQPYKPCLIVVPANLIHQWTGNIRKFSPIIRLTLNHTDPNIKAKDDICNRVKIPLTRDHPNLRPSHEYLPIMLTSFETLGRRHCSDAHKLRMDRGEAKTHVDGSKEEKPANWKHDLSGVFSNVLLDEGHQVRNTGSTFNISIQWLEADFVLIATATPLFHSLGDLVGLMAIMEKAEDRDLYSLGTETFKARTYPWSGDTPEHVRARQTRGAVNDYVNGLPASALSSEQKPHLQDIRTSHANEVLRVRLVRRTPQSAMILSTGQVYQIASFMPSLVKRIQSIVLPSHLRQLYEALRHWGKVHLRAPAPDARPDLQSMMLNRGGGRFLSLISFMPILGFCQPALMAGWAVAMGKGDIPHNHEHYSLTRLLHERTNPRKLIEYLARDVWAGQKKSYARIMALLGRKGMVVDAAEWSAEHPAGSTATLPKHLWRAFEGGSIDEHPDDLGIQWTKGHALWPEDEVAPYQANAMTYGPPPPNPSEHYMEDGKHRHRGGNTLGLFMWYLNASPKLEALAAYVTDIVIRRNQKLVIWTQYPLVQDITTGVLQLMDEHEEEIAVRAMTSSLDNGARATLQEEFNDPESKIKILVCAYGVNSVGMDLHLACSDSVLLDPSPTTSQEIQAVGRNYRLGCIRDTVTVLRAITVNTYEEDVLNYAAERGMTTDLAMVADAPRGKHLHAFYRGKDGTTYHKNGEFDCPILPPDYMAKDIYQLSTTEAMLLVSNEANYGESSLNPGLNELIKKTPTGILGADDSD